MKHIYLLLLSVLVVWMHPPVWATTPTHAAEVAWDDCAKLPLEVQQHVAYFWVPALDKEIQTSFAKLFSFHVNNLSRESDLVHPVKVRDDVWRIDLRDYGWKKEVYNKLAQVDPYFHAKLEAVAVPTVIQVNTVVKTIHACKAYYFNQRNKIWGNVDAGYQFTVQGVDNGLLLLKIDDDDLGIQAADVQIVSAGSSGSKKTIASAPWLPAQTMIKLINATQNEAPLLRADWFFIQTARQVDRNNKQVVGYYDFLGIKKEADLEALAGVDRKVVTKRRQEIRAIIAESGVALHNRQIASLDDGSRSYWESLDVDANEGNKNAVRQLDNDYKPIAKEVYFRLPNGLWGLAAVNAENGQLAASVPDSIASDNKSTSNDHRIHSSLSCIRCHVEGLRPLDDWARKFYANPPGDVKLVSPDYDKLKRLKQLYLGPLHDRYEDDQRYYARILFRLTGWKPKEAAKAYSDFWQAYADTSVTGKQLAGELGVEYDDMLKIIKKYVTVGGNQDSVVIGFLKVPEYTARREYIEEAYPLFQQALLLYGKDK